MKPADDGTAAAPQTDGPIENDAMTNEGAPPPIPEEQDVQENDSGTAASASDAAPGVTEPVTYNPQTGDVAVGGASVGNVQVSVPGLVPEEVRAVQSAGHEVGFVNGQATSSFQAQAEPGQTETPAAPATKKQTVSAIVSGLRQGVDTFLSQTSRNGKVATANIEGFLSSITPQIEQQTDAMLTGDPKAATRNLGFLRDAVASRAGRLAEDFSAAERAAFSAFAASAVHAALTVAIAMA